MEQSLIQLNQITSVWETCVILESLDGKILSWNKGAKILYGYSADEVTGKNHSILVPPGISDETLANLNNLNGKYQEFSHDTIHKKRDGTNILVSVTISPVKNDEGNIIAAFIFVKSISEMDQARELFNAITQSSPIGIYIAQDGKFKYINRQFENILGYGIGELINTDSLNYVNPEDKDFVKRNATDALKNGIQKPYEFKVVTKSGSLTWVLETIISIRYQGKRASLGNLMDITDSKKLEEETRQINGKLTGMVKKLENQNRQNRILSEMRDLLQACSKIEETPPVITGTMKKLFPESAGALFLLNNSRSDMESVSRWGTFPDDTDDNLFPLDACWGLRLGRAHFVEDMNLGPICPHLKHERPNAYICLPLMAKGDVLGLLHLQIGQSKERLAVDIENLKDIIDTLSEYLSLSIANVKLSESLAKQSIQDPLSGLFNRRFMEESLQREILRAKRNQTSIGVIMADLDHFKKFNDTYGHAAGDKIISQVGRLLREKTRGSDIACRYGGEEFVLILPESTIEGSFKRANDLREDMKKMEIVFQGQVLSTITISLGIASYPEDSSKPDELLRIADIALYKAKQAGRDRVFRG